MNKKLLHNSIGNTLVMVMLAIGALSATTYAVLEQLQISKKSVKSIQIKKNQELIEYKIMSLLSDRNICSENFSGSISGVVYTQLVRNGVPFLQVDREYANGTIKINSISSSIISADKSGLNVTYEKKLPGSKKGQVINKTFVVNSEFNPAGQLTSCYLDTDGIVQDAVNSALQKICNGAGVLSNALGECKIFKYATETTPSLESNGPVVDCSSAPGSGIGSYGVDPVSGVFNFACHPIISQVGTLNLPCEFGLKYIGTNTSPTTHGRFECFQLSDIIDDSPQTVLDGANCSIALNVANNKYRLLCTGGSATSTSGNNTTPDPVVGIWSYSAWGACSNDVTCERSRNRICVNSVDNNQILPDSNCPAVRPPAVATQSCPAPNFCPAAIVGAWTVSAWGACSNDLNCNQSRSRTCRNTNSPYQVLPDSNCPSSLFQNSRACPTPNACIIPGGGVELAVHGLM